MQLLFRLLEEKAPLDRGADSRRLTEGCYPNDQISYWYDSAPLDPAPLRPFGAPPLTGEAYGCCKSTTFFILFFMV